MPSPRHISICPHYERSRNPSKAERIERHAARMRRENATTFRRRQAAIAAWERRQARERRAA